MDFFETFFPVAQLTSVCILMFVIVNLDRSMYQLDAENAFLHGEQAKDVYME